MNTGSTEVRSIARSSAVVAAGTTLSRITGFARVAAVAYALGVTTVAGVYSSANETPNMLYELLLGGILTATLVPFFVRQFESDDEHDMNAVFTAACLALAAITVLGIVAAPWIIDLLTLRVEDADKAAQQELATTFLRLFMPQVLFYGFTALATAMLNARRRYAAAAFAPVLNNVVVIAMFLTFARIASEPTSIDGMLDDTALVLLLGLGTTAGVAAMALALVPAMVMAGLRLRFVLELRNRAVIHLLRLSGWSFGYVIANQIALWVVIVLAYGETGGPAAYLAAFAFFQLPHGLVSVSVMTTLTPEMSSAAARGDDDGLRDRLSLGIRLVTVIVLPISVLLVALAKPVIVGFLQRGEFDATATGVVAPTLALFAIGILPFSLYLLLQRVFYAQTDTRNPFLVNCVTKAANIALAFPLFAWLGIPGLALAFSASYFLGMALAAWVARVRLGRIDGQRIASVIVRSVVLSAAVGAAAWATAAALGYSEPSNAIVAAILGSLAASLVFLAGSWILRIGEVLELRKVLARAPGGARR